MPDPDTPSLTPQEPSSGPPEDLRAAAVLARDRAYAPYSRFRVGAALRHRDGRLFLGANVENASYGLAMCAERVAFGQALASGARPREFTDLLVIGDTPQPISPCGACRQVMLELGGPGLAVWLTQLQGSTQRTTPEALLPGAFGPGDLSLDEPSGH